MATIAPEKMKITYTTTAKDMDIIHETFDKALKKIKSECGRDYPLYISGKAVRSEAPPIMDVSPVNTEFLLGKFASAEPKHISDAIDAAYGFRRDWEKTPWQKRTQILRKAAALIRKNKFELAAIMSLEVGKNRLESLGDAEESADLMDYYAFQMEGAGGFVRKMNKITPVEDNTDLLRPWGVFACISPFNFPLALASGMSSAALVAGNTVVFKPSQETPWTGLKLYEIYREAGVPENAIHFITGRGSVIGDSLWKNPKVAGIVFTGSKDTGMHMFRNFSADWVKPCCMELGGKNPAIVMPSADLSAAAEGISKSAWGLQNQKCSACSRVYAHKDIVGPLIEKILNWTKSMKMGDVTERDIFFGPVINKAAVETYKQTVELARKDGQILLGGERLKGGIFDKGHFVAPTVVKAPLSSRLFFEEFFVPVLAIGEVTSLEQAISESNKADYGLTAGIFTKKQNEIDCFFDEIEAGVTYVNKKTGATTGAWPGAQPFCGWKGSGSSGKGGCGPYYVMQFMREQSRTVIQQTT